MCALALAGFALGAQTDVALTTDGPQPSTVTVNWGDTVAFRNADSAAHSILIPAATVTSPEIPQGGTFAHVFDQRKGTFNFVQTGPGPKRRTGQIAVEVRGEVTLETSRERVAFGQAVRLSGTSPYPSSPVVLLQRSIGGQAETELASVTASETGSYTVSFRPEAGSRVRAAVAAGQLRSTTVDVRVSPRLAIAASPKTLRAGRLVTVTGRVVPAKAAESVQFRRYDTRRKAWVRLATKRVSTAGVAVFRWRAVKGRSLLRIEVTRAEAAQSYEPAVSPSVAVKGLAPPR